MKFRAFFPGLAIVYRILGHVNPHGTKAIAAGLKCALVLRSARVKTWKGVVWVGIALRFQPGKVRCDAEGELKGDPGGAPRVTTVKKNPPV